MRVHSPFAAISFTHSSSVRTVHTLRFFRTVDGRAESGIVKETEKTSVNDRLEVFQRVYGFY